MRMNAEYYTQIFNRFKEQYPALANESIEYRPKHIHAIRITLRNGEQIDYNAPSGSFRYVDCTSVTSPDDITDDACRKIFAANLSEIMASRGIGQAILAERTGLSTAIISKYARAKSTPSITNVKKIAHALNCNPYELYE